MKKILLCLSVFVVILGIAAAPALARSHHGRAGKAGATHGKAKLVLNVVAKVTADEDSGSAGYWALDSYKKHIQVWKQADGTYRAVVRYAGMWQTFATALSPAEGIAQGADATGTFHGGYRATFTADGLAAGLRTRGFVGTYDLGGTKDDILLGTYGAGQTGTPNEWDWLTTYFVAADQFVQDPWGWTYRYQDQTWVNASSGNSGDIVISAPTP
jgi:hypothetical protein